MMKKRIFLICIGLSLLMLASAYAQNAGDDQELCWKSGCWMEDGVPKLASAGCPTPTLFVQSSLAELKSYVNGASKFGLTPDQVKKVSELYDQANVVVIQARGALQSSTLLLAQEMTKDMPDVQVVKKLLDDIEGDCWDTVAKLATLVHQARQIVGKK